MINKNHLTNVSCLAHLILRSRWGNNYNHSIFLAKTQRYRQNDSRESSEKKLQQNKGQKNHKFKHIHTQLNKKSVSIELHTTCQSELFVHFVVHVYSLYVYTYMRNKIKEHETQSWIVKFGEVFCMSMCVNKTNFYFLCKYNSK